MPAGVSFIFMTPLCHFCVYYRWFQRWLLGWTFRQKFSQLLILLKSYFSLVGIFWYSSSLFSIKNLLKFFHNDNKISRKLSYDYDLSRISSNFFKRKYLGSNHLTFIFNILRKSYLFLPLLSIIFLISLFFSRVLKVKIFFCFLFNLTAFFLSLLYCFNGS